MLIVANNTELQFMQDLKACRENNPERRFFYLGFSKLHIPKQCLFETFLSVLEEVPKSYMAQVYLCDDGDIIIMMQDFNKFQFLGFVKKLADEVGAEGVMNVIDVLDVKTHWAQLNDMFEAKLAAMDVDKKNVNGKPRALDAEQRILQAYEKMDAEKIKDIHQRRKSGKEPVVLVVDDDQLARTLAANVLEPDNTVYQAENGESAMLQFVDVAPDIVFLDIGLPDINGHEILENIYQIDPSAYVIMFSGRKDKENMLRALKLGASGFIGKPFTREKMQYYAQQCPTIKEKLRLRDDKQAALV